jgi:hypothetical protein
MAGIYHQPFKVRLLNELLKQSFPDAFVTPADEAPVGIAPATVAVG